MLGMLYWLVLVPMKLILVVLVWLMLLGLLLNAAFG